DIRFEGRVHEQLLPAIRRLGGRVEWTNLHVVHSGSDNSPSGQAKKYDRDLRLLQLELHEHPNHPFVLFNLGMTYSDMEEHAVAQQWLERCLAVSDPGESQVRKAYSLLVNSLKSQGQLTEAHEVCLHALDVFPLDVELLFRRGMLEHDLGNYEAAISAYRSILDSREERHFVSMDVGLVDYKTHNNLALVYQDSGQLALAEIQWRSIIAQKPNFEEAWQGLGRNLIDQQKWNAMDLLLTDLHKLPHGSANISWLKAIIAEKQGETACMRPLIEAALTLNPAHALARQDYCRWLFHFGSVEESAKALEELVERDPTDAAAFHNLGLTYVRSGLH
ncbi:MAG TPA: tetratricopeptide repeat protein, partial [Pirellula sp.]|nr:tetratricopeptide repeat protein [Pirellula sp.]